MLPSGAKEIARIARCPHFRAETRAWLEQNCPPVMRTFMPENEQVAGGKRAEYVRPEQKHLARPHGRQGLDRADLAEAIRRRRAVATTKPLILEEEMQDLGCRAPLRGMGLSMLGPVLLEYGTEEQRQTHIPPIVRGEIRWCQGYSEPEAGSDLASLRTRAVLQGEHFLVNGHKIWTSNAHRLRLDLLPRPHRPDGEEARGHQLPADRHGRSRRPPAADPADQRRLGVLRDVLRKRPRSGRQPRRPAQQGLDHRQAPAGARAQGHRRHRARATRPSSRSPLEAVAKQYRRRSGRPDRRSDPARPRRGLCDGRARLPADPPPRGRGSRGRRAARPAVGDVQAAGAPN